MAAPSPSAPQDRKDATSAVVEPAVPRVTLRNCFAHPYDSAIAAARTCYAPRLIAPEEITDKQRTTIGAATFYAGHHTVYQHAHFEFGIENVSRQFVWSLLHAHPFYNSEQQSQRYVRLDRALAHVPDMSNLFGAEKIFTSAVARAWGAYRDLTTLLQVDARAILADIWHLSSFSHPKRAEKVERQAEKKAIEVARYVLPEAAATTMVHTVSGIVLHRLWRMHAASDTPTEARTIVGQMVARVREVDPQFFDRFNDGPLVDLPEWAEAPDGGETQAREFDAQLAGRTSVLLDYSPAAPRVLAQSYRAVVGVSEVACSDAEALDRMLNPARNPYRLETLNVGVHAPLMRPLLVLTDTRAPDFLTPMLIKSNARAREIYERAMADVWQAKNELLDRGVPREFALYLLPNAKAIRLVESGSLLHLLHKWTMRTCFNAQEEIYQASMEEVDQVRAAMPELARYVGPPCYLRANVATPICTEGSHFCGIKVWQEFPSVERRL